MSHQSDLIRTDINAYLAQHERKELLRFLTCGNVDDGKSTLIGRLLHDSKMIYEDQLAAIKADSVKLGTTGGELDLALLVDGLQAEREQGITIDVAYRYFSTATRKFIIADTPGHEQYTRNMATGASTCDLAVILIDARHGVQTQTKRHSFIVSLLGIRHIIVAINKMDLVAYDATVFEKIKADYLHFAEKLDLHDIRFIPISALTGDNVVNLSPNMPWYQGQSLMTTLETIEIASDRNFTDGRLPVQYVNRPNLDFRGFCGTIAAGIFRPGDAITVWPSGKSSRIARIVTFDGDLAEAVPPMAVTLTLTDEIDISRGDMMVPAGQQPWLGERFRATVIWMTEKPLAPARSYWFKLATRVVSGTVSSIHHRIDVNTLEHHPATQLQLNEIAECDIALQAPVVFDSYGKCKTTGAFIVIDRLSNVTVGAGMILSPATSDADRPVTADERAQRFNQRAGLIALTGYDREHVAYALERRLFDAGYAACVWTANAETVSIQTFAAVIRQAGLLGICTTDLAGEYDWLFDTDRDGVESIYQQLQQQNIIF